MHKMTRRRFVQGTTGLLAMHAVPAVATLRSTTPRQSAGPFYPLELPLDDDNDLTHVAGREQTAQLQDAAWDFSVMLDCLVARSHSCAPERHLQKHIETGPGTDRDTWMQKI